MPSAQELSKSLPDRSERVPYADLPAGLLAGMRSTESHLGASGLDGQLLELVRLRVSALNACAYCLDMHDKLARHRGESQLRIVSLPAWRETDFYSESECLALELAEALTLVAVRPVPSQLLDRGMAMFGKQAFCELTLAITQCNAWNRLAKSFAFRPGNFEV